MRLDQYLVGQNLTPSRARAQSLIKQGAVVVNSMVVLKPSHPIVASDEVSIVAGQNDYVSRGALKLEKAVTHFNIDPSGKICLDLGASTGGFCDVLLRRGAAKIYAVDVGHGQLHEKIAQHPHIVNLEKTHAKMLTASLIPDPIDLLVCDVSFISLKKALPPALTFCQAGSQLALLVKPQFEVGRDNIGKGGLVKQSFATQEAVAENIADWLQYQDWDILGYTESPITGGDGNREFLLGAVKKI
ncbi:MAG: TlyA family RNA methyltransferase [bacterium]